MQRKIGYYKQRNKDNNYKRLPIRNHETWKNRIFEELRKEIVLQFYTQKEYLSHESEIKVSERSMTSSPVLREM